MPTVRRWKVATSTRTMPEIALLIAEGRSNPEIAERLGISRFTARDHAEQIFVRLKVESRWLVARALFTREFAPPRIPFTPVSRRLTLGSPDAPKKPSPCARGRLCTSRSSTERGVRAHRLETLSGNRLRAGPSV